jgi:hypothetical protein
MVSVSRETPEQIDSRLRLIITQARLHLYPGSYAFLEFPLASFPAAARSDALAFVRDDEVWSQLVPTSDEGHELFAIFRFHFPPDVDNSGFVVARRGTAR